MSWLDRSIVLIPIGAVLLVVLIGRRSAHNSIKDFMPSVALACLPVGGTWFAVTLACAIARDPARVELWLLLAILVTILFVVWREIWKLLF